MLRSITRETITNQDDLIDFGLELGFSLTSIQQRCNAKSIETASFMMVVEWWYSLDNSREDNYKILLDTVRSMGKKHTDVADRLERVLHLSGSRSDSVQYLSTVQNPWAGAPFGNESKPQNESLSDSLSIEGNYDGEDSMITLRRREGKDIAASDVKVETYFDNLNLPYDRIATHHNNESVYSPSSEKFFNVIDRFGVTVDCRGNEDVGLELGNTSSNDTARYLSSNNSGTACIIHKTLYETGVMNDQRGVKNGQTDVVNDQTGVVNDQTDVLNGQTGVVNDQTGTVNGQTEVEYVQTGVENGQKSVVISKTGVVDDQMGESLASENHHNNRNTVNQNVGKSQRIFSSSNLSFAKEISY